MADDPMDANPPWQMGDIRPRPDPTELTRRSTEAAKDDLRREMDFRLQVIVARLDAIHEADRLMQDWRETLPRRLEEGLACERNVSQERFARIEEVFQTQNQKFISIDRQLNERFAGIALQFDERDTRGEQGTIAAKTAVDAALQAQKESAQSQTANINQSLARIEATTTKQFDSIVTLLQTTVAALDSKLGDLKDRLTLIEGRTAGITAAGTTQRDAQSGHLGGNMYIMAILGFCVTVFLGLAALAVSLFRLSR